MKSVSEVIDGLLHYWDGDESELFAALDDEDLEEEGYWEQMERQHGKVVKRTFSAYHDEAVYEDGYVDRDYIGDKGGMKMPRTNLCKQRDPTEEARIRLLWNIKKNMELQNIKAEQIAPYIGMAPETFDKKLQNSRMCEFKSSQLTALFRRLKFSNYEILESVGGCTDDK